MNPLRQFGSCFLLLSLCISLSPLAVAAVYKCKNADGSILWSDKRCAGELLEERKDKGDSRRGSSGSQHGDIDSVADALVRIRFDGFGDYELRELKRLADFGETKKINTDLKIAHDQNDDFGQHNFWIQVGPGRAIITYHVSLGSIDRSLSSFDITQNDILHRASRIGLQKKMGASSSAYKWEWKSNGFQCLLMYGMRNPNRVESLWYQCRYRKNNI